MLKPHCCAANKIEIDVEKNPETCLADTASQCLMEFLAGWVAQWARIIFGAAFFIWHLFP